MVPGDGTGDGKGGDVLTEHLQLKHIWRGYARSSKQIIEHVQAESFYRLVILIFLTTVGKLPCCHVTVVQDVTFPQAFSATALCQACLSQRATSQPMKRCSVTTTSNASHCDDIPIQSEPSETIVDFGRLYIDAVEGCRKRPSGALVFKSIPSFTFLRIIPYSF